MLRLDGALEFWRSLWNAPMVGLCLLHSKKVAPRQFQSSAKPQHSQTPPRLSPRPHHPRPNAHPGTAREGPRIHPHLEVTPPSSRGWLPRSAATGHERSATLASRCVSAIPRRRCRSREPPGQARRRSHATRGSACRKCASSNRRWVRFVSAISHRLRRDLDRFVVCAARRGGLRLVGQRRR